MSKKNTPRWRIAPLQHIVAELITDPAELAAIDRVRQARIRREQKKNAKPRKKN